MTGLLRFAGTVLVGLWLTLTGSPSAIAQSAVESVAEDGIRLHNLADDFATVWANTQGLPSDQRVAAFHEEVVPGFPEYYAADTLTGGDAGLLDEQVAAALEAFGSDRERYLERVAGFASALDDNVRRFRQAFPDFDDDLDIYLIHSLGRMNGGTRELGGRVRLIFGADMMVRFHHWQDDRAFFQHELFHIHHASRFEECEQVWCALWSEGLATHVAATLVPDAGLDELLLTIPANLVPDTEARWGDALKALRGHLDTAEESVVGNLFQFGDGEFPPRHGYYLGWRLAERVARTLPLEELVDLDNEAVRPLLAQALDGMIEVAASGDGAP